jgi:DNA-binding winged helix-turn-helix (wHTH) protein
MTSRTYRFGEFELHEALFELRRGGVRVALQPKALDVLLYLLRHRDRVVPKEELLGQVWPGVVVSEASLNKAVAAIRRALGERGVGQSCVETARGRGFRFAAAVEVLDDAGVAESRPSAFALAAAESEGRFVGRDDVLSMIAGAFSGAEHGAGRLILLSGEAGMGKTRTALEAAARCRHGGGRALMGWCSHGESAPVLWPWLPPLRQLVAECEPIMHELADERGELTSLLHPPRASLRDRAAPSLVAPEHERFRLFDAVARLLELASRRGAHLLILDDFHWADRASLSLLDFVSHGVSSSRLLLLVTYREEELEQGSLLVELSRRPGCEIRALAGLSRDESARLVENEVGSVSTAVADFIHERSEGNPFFVRELARALAARRSLGAAAPVAGVVPLPAGVREVLRQRLDRLSPGCRETLVLAAAMGDGVDLPLLTAASGLAPEPLLERLDEARGAHVLRSADAGYSFTHALVREALLEQLTALERARLHRWIAEALEVRHREDLEPCLPALAFHYCAAAPSGCVEQAIKYARLAGEHAAGILAADEAAVHYRGALEALALAPAPDDHLRCELLVVLGEAQMLAAQTDDGHATLRQAVSLARRLGAGELLARASLASGELEFSSEIGVHDPDLIALLEEGLAALPARDSTLRVRLQVRLAIALCWVPALDRARELVEDALVSARRLGDPAAVAHALYVHRWAPNGPGDMERRLGESEEMLRLARSARRRDLELAALSCRFIDLTELGRLAEADRELAAYDGLAQELRVPRYRWRARFYHAMRALLDGRFDQAEELALQAFADGQRFKVNEAAAVFGVQMLILRLEQGRVAEVAPVLHGFANRLPAVPAWRASLPLLHVELDERAEARDSFESFAVDDFRAIPGDVNWLSAMALLAETCCLLEDAARAGTLYALLRPFAPRLIMVGVGVACWGTLDRILGSLAVTAGNWDAAAQHLEAAQRMNTRVGARGWAGWTHHDWARLLLRRGGAGDREQAELHLAKARETAASLGMARLAGRVEALAERASETTDEHG